MEVGDANGSIIEVCDSHPLGRVFIPTPSPAGPPPVSNFPWWEDSFLREVADRHRPVIYALTRPSKRKKGKKVLNQDSLHEVGSENRVKFAKLISLKGMGCTCFGSHPSKARKKRNSKKNEDRELKKRRVEEAVYIGSYKPKIIDVVSVARRTRSTLPRMLVCNHPSIEQLLLFDTEPADITKIDLTNLAAKSMPFTVDSTKFCFERAVSSNAWACSVTYNEHSLEQSSTFGKALMSDFPLPVGQRLDGDPVPYYRNKHYAKTALLFGVLCRDPTSRAGFVQSLMQSRKKPILKLTHQREFEATWAVMYIHAGDGGVYIVDTSGGFGCGRFKLV